MKNKYKTWLLAAGVIIIALLVVLLVLVSSGPDGTEEDSGESTTEYVVPSDGDYSKYEANYDEMYKLIEYSKAHPEETELSEYVNRYLDKIDSMAMILPINYTSVEDSYSFYSITNGSSRTDCPVFCVYIEAATPYMYEEALAELQRVSKYPLEEYTILKKVLYYPIGEPEEGE